DRFRRIREEAHLRRHVTLHDLRRAHVTHLMEAGVHLRTLQVLLGHSSPTTTAIYTPVSAELIAKSPCPLELLDQQPVLRVSPRSCSRGWSARRMPLTVNDALRRFVDDYRAHHRPTPHQDRVLDWLCACRTAALGGRLLTCACGWSAPIYNS